MRRNRLLLVFLIHILLLFTVQAKVEFSLELFGRISQQYKSHTLYQNTRIQEG